MAVTVDIRDEVTPALKALQAGVSPGNLNPAIGAAVKMLFQSHFIQLPPNKMGWPSTHFWAQAARATSWALQPDGVVVSVNKQGVRQRYYGGEIHPTGGRKYLTIPARAEAYGKRAADFHNLRLAFRREGGVVRAWALVQAAATTFSRGKKRKDGSQKLATSEVGGAVMFWLVKSVNQVGDEGIIPSNEEIATTAMTVVNAAVERAWRRAAGAQSQ